MSPPPKNGAEHYWGEGEHAPCAEQYWGEDVHVPETSPVPNSIGRGGRWGEGVQAKEIGP
jgi:hypothetical protein